MDSPFSAYLDFIEKQHQVAIDKETKHFLAVEKYFSDLKARTDKFCKGSIKLSDSVLQKFKAELTQEIIKITGETVTVEVKPNEVLADQEFITSTVIEAFIPKQRISAIATPEGILVLICREAD